MKIPQTITALAIALAALGANGAYAGDIVYGVDQTIGPGSVTGTITTNGTIGTLSAADIVSFDLTLNDGVNIATLSSPGTVYVNKDACCTAGLPGGDDLTATAKDLMFNYSGTDSGDFVIVNSQFQLCYTAVSNCWGPTGVGMFNVGGDGRSVYVAESGNQIIATAVPEPVTWAMILLGAGMVGGGLRFARRGNGMALTTT